MSPAPVGKKISRTGDDSTLGGPVAPCRLIKASLSWFTLIRGEPSVLKAPSLRSSLVLSYRHSNKMRMLESLLVVMMAALVATFPETASARYETSPEDKAVDGQVWRDFAGFLVQVLRNADGAASSPMCHHKRNSEIINSLLGLPKTMTDAGRK